jgi:hypothetical protein
LVSFGRWSGLAAMLGGGLWSLKSVADVVTGAHDITDALFFVVPLLLLVGLVSLHIRYGGHAAGIGRAGFTQSFIGLALLAVGLLAESLFGSGAAGQITSFGFLVLALGLVLLGFGTLRHEALPRWNFLPLMMGVLILLSVVAGDAVWLRVAISALFGLGWVLLGAVLLSKGEMPDGES